MNQTSHFPFVISLTKTRLFTAVISLLFSILAFQLDGLMNSDGILYMNMAKAYLDGGLQATAQLYDWPFFSILVATLHQFTGLSLEHAAQLLNTVLFVIFTDAILLLSSRLLANPFQVAIAAVFILSFIIINDYRSYIIRDIGYWAMIMLSLYRMAMFHENRSWLNATSWQAVTVLALLFRVEALVILLALPLTVFVNRPFKLALLDILKLSYLLIIGGLLIVAVFLQQHGFSAAFGKLGKVTGYLQFSGLLDKFELKSDLLADGVLNQYSADYSGLILSSGLLVMFIHKIVIGLSVGYLAIFAYSFLYGGHKPVAQDPVTRRLLHYFIVINAVILLTFLFDSYFLSSRYMVVLFVSLLLLILPSMCQMVEQAFHARQKRILVAVTLVLLIGVIDSFTSSVTKGYIKDAAIWASQELPDNTKVLTDDLFIDFYFKENGPKASLKLAKRLNNYHKFDYLIVIQKRKHNREKELQQLDLRAIHETSNERGDKTVIYQVVKHES